MKAPALSRLLVAVLALAHVTCQAILTAPPKSILNLVANPLSIPANGGVSIISATVTEEIGTPVPDGTVVQFFTTLGRIDEQGRTNDGVARVKLVSDSRSGTATVTAFSGGAETTDTLDVTIGNVNVDEIIMRAQPPRITNSNSTHVFAAVFDENGNPVPNVPVLFTVNDNPQTEFFETSSPVFTNNNGEAENVLRTRRTLAGIAKVEATLPGSDAVGRLSIPIQ